MIWWIEVQAGPARNLSGQCVGEKLMKENSHVYIEEARFRSCGGSPTGDRAVSGIVDGRERPLVIPT
jgi:hypothetical protein